MAKKIPLTVERRDLVKILGVSSVRRLAELESDGVIAPLRRGRGGRASTYSLEVVVPAYLAFMTSAPASGEERAARTEHYKSQTARNNLAIETAMGDLVPIEEVVAAGQQMVKSWTAKIRALPRQMVQTGVIPREKEGRTAELLRALLSEIAAWRPGERSKKKAS